MPVDIFTNYATFVTYFIHNSRCPGPILAMVVSYLYSQSSGELNR